MKTIKMLFAASLILISFSMASCSKQSDTNSADELLANSEALLKSSDWGLNTTAQDSLCNGTLPLEELNEFEIEALTQMREEELLAQDIYLQLFEIYQYRVFEQIAKSETKHADAVKTLIDRYELADPALDHQLGVFNSGVLQQLHDNLLAEAKLSGVNALKVGATIEDVDIYDLKELLANGIDNQDITFVFQNLLRGSENHMRAFVRALASQSETYTPQYISQEEYALILASSNGQGNGNRNGTGSGNANRKGGNGNGRGGRN